MPISLLELISQYKAEYGLNEYELYRLIEVGFHSFFKFRVKGMPTDVMTYLQRASRREQSWVLDGSVMPIAEWVERYKAWRQ